MAFPARRRSRRHPESNCPRSRSPHPHRPEPNPRKTDLRRRSIDLAPRRTARGLRRRPAQKTGIRDRLERRIAKRFAKAAETEAAGRQFSGIVGTASTRYYRRRDSAFARAQTLQEIIAQTPGVQLTSPVWRRQRRQDQRRPPRIWRFRDLEYAGAHQWPKAQRHRHGPASISRKFRDDSIERIEITRGNSGAVLYGDNAIGGVINIVLKNGVGGPPVAMRAEAGVGSFDQRLASSRQRPTSARGRHHSTATPSSPTATAQTTRSTSSNGVGDVNYTTPV